MGAVQRCGGFRAVAGYLGVAYQETRGRPQGSRSARVDDRAFAWL